MTDMPATEDPQPSAAPPVTTCFRHPKRESYIRCTRCERYICPDCMREAPVGHQCPECVKEGQQSIRQARTVFGGRLITVPVLTYLLIALNVLAYVAELLVPHLVDRFDNLGLGVMGPDGGLYTVSGGFLPHGFHLVGIARGDWYRLITSAFLHQPPTGGRFGITHILFNMYSLWMFGRVVEQQLGRLRFLALYLLAALGGSVLAYQLAPTEPAIGASGAIFGLVGGYFLMTRRMRHDPLGGGQQLIYSLVWLVVSAGITSWQGHLGGLLAGGAVGAAFVFAPRNGRVVVQALGALAVLAVLVLVVLAKNSELASTVPWGDDLDGLGSFGRDGLHALGRALGR